MIRILLVEDSNVSREYLMYLISRENDLKVIATASNGKDAVDLALRLKPDVITMDINMPKLDGFQATREIMEKSPVPIIIVTASWDPKHVSTTFKALEAGAVSVIPKPLGSGHTDSEKLKKDFIKTIRIMSEVKVVRRIKKPTFLNSNKIKDTDITTPNISSYNKEFKIAAIGASTGGPQIIQQILNDLPNNFFLPILIVQHIAAGFVEGFIDWLNSTTKLRVKLAEDGEQPIPGFVYLAPDDYHMGLLKTSRTIKLSKAEKENGLRPSVSYLFRSVAEAFPNEAVGILLTGMGKDGSEELGLMKNKGALTIVQDEESSIVFGMPGEAVKIGAANLILDPKSISKKLKELAKE